jgi:polyhydroxybutyrate depolymerase
MQEVTEKYGFIYLHPDGTKDYLGKQMWNSTDACCDYLNVGPNDVDYMNRLIKDVSAKFTVDSKRIYFAGHSNGGFHSFRMACSASSTVAAIMSLGGATYDDIGLCEADHPVNILVVHGTGEEDCLYGGGQADNGRRFPGAEQSVASWMTLNKCTAGSLTAGTPFDLDYHVDGPETTPYTASCPGGGEVQFWKMRDSMHIPALAQDFNERLI